MPLVVRSTGPPVTGTGHVLVTRCERHNVQEWPRACPGAQTSKALQVETLRSRDTALPPPRRRETRPPHVPAASVTWPQHRACHRLPHRRAQARPMEGPLGQPSESRDVVPSYRVRPSNVVMVFNSATENRRRTSPSSQPPRAPGRSLEHSGMCHSCAVNVHPNENKQMLFAQRRTAREWGPRGHRARDGARAGGRQLRTCPDGPVRSGRRGTSSPEPASAAAAQGTAWALSVWSEAGSSDSREAAAIRSVVLAAGCDQVAVGSGAGRRDSRSGRPPGPSAALAEGLISVRSNIQFLQRFNFLVKKLFLQVVPHALRAGCPQRSSAAGGRASSGLRRDGVGQQRGPSPRSDKARGAGEAAQHGTRSPRAGEHSVPRSEAARAPRPCHSAAPCECGRQAGTRRSLADLHIIHQL